MQPTSSTSDPPLQWSWPLEHADREKERKADAEASSDSIHHSGPFEVDRRVLKDVVREKLGGVEVARIQFLSAGTFHKAYLTTLTTSTQVVVRVARRFMPRLKTESEVATIEYLRRYTNVPVPRVLAYDSNPWNRLGGEYIIMDKAAGIPLAKVYHSLSYTELVGLLRNLAALIIPLFAHRFTGIGSFYLNDSSSSTYTKPKIINTRSAAAATDIPTPPPLPLPDASKPFHIGPIISWPFFGSSRGLLTHPTEINRGPWSSTQSYLSTCSTREISSISILENQGKISSHKLHLSPDEVRSSRYHRVSGPGVDGFDESDESDEWDLEESEEDEWEEGGWGAYRDYRRGVRGAFLVKVLNEREERVRSEMGRWEGVMMRLGEKLVGDLGIEKDEEEEEEEELFALDCHDLSLENIFVSAEDHTKITCIIDWEATTTRPLWAAAHLPSFLRSSVFVSRLFRRVVEELMMIQSQGQEEEIERWIPESYRSSLPSPNSNSNSSSNSKLASLTREWLSYESSGAPLRLAHRCVEWDGWEEGLVDSILGPEPEAGGVGELLQQVAVEGHAGGVGEVPGEGGTIANASEGLVWGWGVNGHGHVHGLTHGEEAAAAAATWTGMMTSAPPSTSRPPFLHLNSSYHLASVADVGVGGGGGQMKPLFPLVPLQAQVSSSSKEEDGMNNGIVQNGNARPNGMNEPFSNGLLKPKAQAYAHARSSHHANANAKKQNNKTPNPPPTASTRTALLLSTQTEQAEKAMEKMLDGTGDICGGRGGELGRRLEAWLVRSGGGAGAGVQTVGLGLGLAPGAGTGATGDG